MSFKGKIVVVVGATGVIGNAIAKKFSRDGAILVLTSSSQTNLKKLKIGHMNVAVNVTSETSVKNLFKKIEKKYGRVDVIVTAFGIQGSIGLFSDIKPQAWESAIDVNLFGVVRCLYYAIPLLKKSKRGKILLFSGGSEGPKPRLTSYIASKSAIIRFGETLANELREYHIDVNSIAPGPVNSGFNQYIIKAGKNAGYDLLKEAHAQISGTSVTVNPEIVADLVTFLASDKSNGITGKNISAIRDPWKDFPKHMKDIIHSDVYTFHRIKPKEKGYDW